MFLIFVDEFVDEFIGRILKSGVIIFSKWEVGSIVESRVRLVSILGSWKFDRDYKIKSL